MKTFNARCLTNPIFALDCFCHKVWSSREYLIHYQSVIFFLSINDQTSPPIMLIIEPKMVGIFLTHSPIFIKHMSFWC